MRVGLDGFHVVEVGQHGDRLLVVVESAAAVTGCGSCGVIATSRGRRDVVLWLEPSEASISRAAAPILRRMSEASSAEPMIPFDHSM